MSFSPTQIPFSQFPFTQVYPREKESAEKEYDDSINELMQQDYIHRSLIHIPVPNHWVLQLLGTLFVMPLIDVFIRTLGSVVSVLHVIGGERVPAWLLRYHPGIFHGNFEFGWEKKTVDNHRNRMSFGQMAKTVTKRGTTSSVMKL